MPWPHFPTLRILRSVVWTYLGFAGVNGNADAATIDFLREIQPILSSRCYDCHGSEKPKGGLQLTARNHALRGGESGEPAIVAGNSTKSVLIQRITATDDDDVMPQKGERLTAEEIALLKQWIDQGATWPENIKHWAYIKPTRPALPTIRNPDARIQNPIDNFVLARLERAGLKQSPATDKARWLRRVSLDLVGLPPTPVEIDAFLADPSEHAFDRVVDRLLASPHYGERWARPWLDLARYADSHGFQRDDLRDIWPYRDWVIKAMNADMPFDQFSIWQLAGDLIPETPNLEPLIATGFHRSAPTNVEAGTDQEEGRVNQVFDRVNTTAAVWLGSTLECAQCHNHKYDPFTQKEYYQLFAYFNNTTRETDFTTPKAMAALKFTGPFLELPDAKIVVAQIELQARLKSLDEQIAMESKRLLAGRDAWEQTAAATLTSTGETHVLEIADFESVGGSAYKILPDKSVLLVDDAPDRDTYVIKVTTKLTGITGFKLEALTDPSLPGGGPGRGDAARPNFVLNSFRVTVAAAGGGAGPVTFTKATASFEQPKFAVENLLRPDNDGRGGWAIGGQFFREHWATFATEKPLGSSEGTTFTFTLVQNFGTGRTIGRLRLSALTGVVGAKALPADIATILHTPNVERTAAQVVTLTNYFLAQDKTIEGLKLAKLKATQDAGSLKGPQTLVMRELPEPRPTNVLNRGNFLDAGEHVLPGTPAALHASRPAPDMGGTPMPRETAMQRGTGVPPVSASVRPTRLDLARWLVDKDNPLVARVTVNRWWAEFFGRGLVSTLEDFGVKGDFPSHPELLDWLAVEFMERGWSMKHVHKLIVLSATYGQSSRVTPELLARDDQNKLLARGPRFRLDAETIRDNALAAAGLLSLKQGGPPVRPYQPPGLWENKVGGDRVTYDVSTGEDAWRRGIYTVWKRSSPYPSFMTFDATARTACTIRRSRSNTPLQALTLLNDPVYVEAAMALAKRVLTERPSATTDDRIRYAFQICLARVPNDEEIAALKHLLEQQDAVYGSDGAAAKALIGKFALPTGTSAAELASWYAVATALLNLDEMITKT
jgi:hypothetical protein